MAQILVRNLDEKIMKHLKKRAKSGGRSLQSEVKAILEEAARRLDMETALRTADSIRHQFAGRKFSNSAVLIRKDRES